MEEYGLLQTVALSYGADAADESQGRHEYPPLQKAREYVIILLFRMGDFSPGPWYCTRSAGGFFMLNSIHFPPAKTGERFVG